jgi:hypothetical protein
VVKRLRELVEAAYAYRRPAPPATEALNSLQVLWLWSLRGRGGGQLTELPLFYDWEDATKDIVILAEKKEDFRFTY